jgi:hypothetical protein
MLGVPHPTNDPSLVSYHRPELIRQLPALELAYHCWHLLDTTFVDKNGSTKSIKQRYLPQEPAEPRGAYEARLNRSTYAPIYRDSIRAYAGLLNRFQLIDVPQSLLGSEKDIDLQGESIQSFYNRCDEKVLRDGGVFVMVDMTPEEGEINFLDEQQSGRRPYLIMVERSNVINWSIDYQSGREKIAHATIRQFRQRQVPGSYGVELDAIYHVLRPNLVQTYRLEKQGRDWQQILEREIETSIPIVPLVWYGATDPHFAHGDLPLNGLAELSVQHFQMRSDLNELLHKCAMPVPVRTGARLGADGKPIPLILGPNTAVDLDAEGGKFEFAEPSGRSLERHQAEIAHLESLMDRSSLNFLYGANIKTATEASLRASQIASQVASLVRNKSASFNTVMRLWAAYSGELAQIMPESGIAINDSLINRPLGASEIAQLVNLYSQGILSKRTVLDELQRGGILDPDLKIEDEIGRTEEDHKDELDQMIEDQLKEKDALEPAEPTPSGNQPADDSNSRDSMDEVQTPEKAQASASRAQ